MILYDITVELKEYQYVCIMEILIICSWFSGKINPIIMTILWCFCLYGLLSNMIYRHPSGVLIGQYFTVCFVLAISCYSQSTIKDENLFVKRKLTLVEQKRVWEDHLKSISDLILIVNDQCEKIYSNQAYLKICEEENLDSDKFDLIRQMTRLKLADGNHEEFNNWLQEKHKLQDGVNSIFRSLSTGKGTMFQTINSNNDQPLGRRITRKRSKHGTLSLAIDLEVLIGMISKDINEYSDIMGERELVVYSKLRKRNNRWSSFAVKITVSSEGENKVLFILITETTHRDLAFRLEEVNNFKSQLLGSISHELRTPLNSSILYLQRAELSPLIPEKIKQSTIKPAMISAQLLSFLVNDILDLSQMELKSLTLNFSKEQLHSSVMKTIELFKIHEEAKKFKILFDIESDIPDCVKTDFLRLNRILVNLLKILVANVTGGEISIKTHLKDNFINFRVAGKGAYSQEDIEQIQVILTGGMVRTPKSEVSDKYFCLHVATRLAQALSSGRHKVEFRTSLDNCSEFCFAIEQIMEDENHREIAFSDEDDYGEPNKGLTKTLSRLATAKLSTKKLTRNESILDRVISLSINEDKGEDLENKGEDKSSRGDGLMSEEQGLRKEEVVDMREFDVGAILTTRHEAPFHGPATKILAITKYRETAETDHDEERNYFSRECNCDEALIVDDDALNVHSLKMLLNSYKIECEVAYDGKSAVEKVLGKKRCGQKCKLFSIIFLDCNMPKQDGVTTAEQLKQNMKGRDLIEDEENKKEDNCLPYIPIVVWTAYIQSQQAAKWEEIGIDEFMEKPIVSRQLIEILKKYNVIKQYGLN